MFDFVRRHNKIMMSLMFLLIIPGFVLVGASGFRSISEATNTVASIGNHSITQTEWDQAHKVEVDRKRQQMPNVDVKLLDSSVARYATLEQLVHERVLAEAVQDSHLVITDGRLLREMRQSQNPTLLSLFKPDGSLDGERYRQLVASQGLTTQEFEGRLRNQLSLQQAEGGFSATAFAPAALSDIVLTAYYERRELQVTPFTPTEFASKINPTDADIEAYYKANINQFKSPESASIEYVVLDMESVKKTIVLNEADVKSYYDQNVARLSGKEERRASHILINAPKSMAADDRKKARERAQAILDAVRKAPDTFADSARKNSQDEGSGSKGGDLDFFGRGAMVKPFEDAAFAMKKGDISDLVESDFGYHIIKLTDINTPKQRSFEELRPTIEADLKTQQAQHKFAEAADAFTNGVFEQSDSLKSVAEKLKLEIKVATNLARQPAPGVTGVLANPKFLAAVFSSDSLEKKHNTEAVEVAVNQLASARVTQYAPAAVRPLADVRANVKERLVATRSTELAKKEGAEKLAAWKAAAPANLPAPVVTVSRDAAQGVPPPVLEAAMHADTSTLPAWIGVDLGTQGYAVVRVNKVLPRNPAPADMADKQRKQYAQSVAAAESKAYYKNLEQRFKVTIKVPAPVANMPGQQTAAE